MSDHSHSPSEAGEAPRVKLTVARGGPLRVSDPDGALEIVWSDGEDIALPNPRSFSICRCGASTKKPFCDGSHSRVGFEKAAEAVPESAAAEREGDAEREGAAEREGDAAR